MKTTMWLTFKLLHRRRIIEHFRMQKDIFVALGTFDTGLTLRGRRTARSRVGAQGG